MQTNTKSLANITELAKQYVNNKIEYAELKALDKGSTVVANVITEVVVILCGVMAFLFATITLAFYLSQVLGSYTFGFGAISLIYLLIALIVFLTKDNYIEKFVINRIIKKYAKNEE